MLIYTKLYVEEGENTHIVSCTNKNWIVSRRSATRQVVQQASEREWKEFCFFKHLFYTKKQRKKVNEDCKQLETMKKIKNSEENK
jgi:hypothetical protein